MKDRRPGNILRILTAVAIFAAALACGSYADSKVDTTRDGSSKWVTVATSGSRGISITHPSRNTTSTDNRITIKGKSSGRDVRVVVYTGSKKVKDVRTSVSGGYWQTYMTLPGGRYRAVATNSYGYDAETSFVVNTDGVTSSFVSITHPSSGTVSRDNDVTFRGKASGSTVRLLIYMGSKKVKEARAGVSNDYWQTSMRLAGGRYRAVAQNSAGREATTSFTVDTDGVSGGSTISISHPSNGATSTDSRVTLRGWSSGREVRVAIYRGSSKVKDYHTRVNSSRWETTVTLPDGSYRASVVNSSGRSASVRFTVRDR